MAVSAGDFIRVTIRGTFLEQVWVNRYWYLVNTTATGTDASQACVEHLDINVYQVWQDMAHEDWRVTDREGYLWKQPSQDYFVNSGDSTGAITEEDPVPSNLCYSFGKAPNFPGERWGFKRFSGFTETNISGNTVVATSEANAMAVALGGIVTSTSGIVMYPCTVITTSVPPIDSGANPTFGRGLLGTWTYKLGSQNSRKPGYGD